MNRHVAQWVVARPSIWHNGILVPSGLAKNRAKRSADRGTDDRGSNLGNLLQNGRGLLEKLADLSEELLAFVFEFVGYLKAVGFPT